MHRRVTPELLDTDAGSEEEIQASLADLRSINRRFGGIATTNHMVEQVFEQTGKFSLSLLDVASGSGDVSAAVSRSMARQGVCLSYTLLDSAVSHLNGYRPSIVANALALPFRDRSFDLVSCSLFLHHLEPAEIRSFMAEALRVCRIAVLVNDLRRSALHLALIYAGFPLFNSRITRNDSLASVRRSYTPDEVRRMLTMPEIDRLQIESHYLFRMGAIAWKRL